MSFNRLIINNWQKLALLALLIGWGVWFSPTSLADDPKPRVNMPRTTATSQIPVPERAVFWFGQVDSTTNYTDVRLIYNDTTLIITLHTFDRQLWYDTSPVAATLTDWDSTSVYLHLDGASGDNPTANSYRFVTQVHQNESDLPYQTAYRGTGAGWSSIDIPFTSDAGWRGGPNNAAQNDDGWVTMLKIPFSSLGLSGPPNPGTVWGLATAVHDRDDAAATAIADQRWPATMNAAQPTTWGELRFGDASYSPSFSKAEGLTTLRHGLNGVTITDAHVGGHSTCGDGLNYWTEWGFENYAGYPQINIQNQWDVADWRCFSKYYITVPLDSLPPGKIIISATLTMKHFGTAGGGFDPGPQPSRVQAFTIDEDWSENTLTWNNAPQAVQNIAATWVSIEDVGYPGLPIEWDVGLAVAQAYAANQPLRLALYSADSERHSGRYFYSSDADAAVRPTLSIRWGLPTEPTDWVYLPLVLR